MVRSEPNSIWILYKLHNLRSSFSLADAHRDYCSQPVSDVDFDVFLSDYRKHSADKKHDSKAPFLESSLQKESEACARWAWRMFPEPANWRQAHSQEFFPTFCHELIAFIIIWSFFVSLIYNFECKQRFSYLTWCVELFCDAIPLNFFRDLSQFGISITAEKDFLLSHSPTVWEFVSQIGSELPSGNAFG